MVALKKARERKFGRLADEAKRKRTTAGSVQGKSDNSGATASPAKPSGWR